MTHHIIRQQHEATLCLVPTKSKKLSNSFAVGLIAIMNAFPPPCVFRLDTTLQVKRTIYEYCSTSFSAESWQYRDRRKHEAGILPYSYSS